MVVGKGGECCFVHRKVVLNGPEEYLETFKVERRKGSRELGGIK